MSREVNQPNASLRLLNCTRTIWKFEQNEQKVNITSSEDCSVGHRETIISLALFPTNSNLKQRKNDETCPHELTI